MVAVGLVTMIVVAVIAGILLEMWLTDEFSPPKKRPRRADVEQQERVVVAAGASAIVRLGAPHGQRGGPSPAGVTAPI
jgi:hypothetical protein